MTPTEEMLLSKHGAVVHLESVCELYFGVGVAQARRLAALNQLPVATFKARDSQKAPILIRTTDLAAWIDQVGDQAQREWRRSQL